jgi:hypothetical protein
MRVRQICGEVETEAIAWSEGQLGFSRDREEFSDG